MPETLAVHLGREGRRSLEAPSRFEAHGPFQVELVNHGPAAHVYLQVDDTVAQVTSFDAENYYVEAESSRTVHVDVAPADEHVRGELSIATGYGAEDRSVTLEIQAPERRTVEVDESLSTPSSPPPASGDARLVDRLSPLAIGGLVVVALALAAGAYLLTEGSLVVGLAAFIVVAAVFAAITMLVR